jgi:hypothetical protein
MSDIRKIEETFAKIFQYLADKDSKLIESVEPFGDKYNTDDGIGGMIIHLKTGKAIKIILSGMP